MNLLIKGMNVIENFIKIKEQVIYLTCSFIF